MLTWGSMRREKAIAQGQFFCPQCNDLRLYKHKQISMYVTLYSIPLFKTQNLGDLVECQSCRTRFHHQILDPKIQAMFKLIASARHDFLHGISPAETKSKLVDIGLANDVADAVIKMVQV